MYPSVMWAFKFPTGKPDVRTCTGLLSHKHNFLPLQELFSLQKGTVIPAKYLSRCAFQNTILSSLRLLFLVPEWLGRWPLWNLSACYRGDLCYNISFLNILKAISKLRSKRRQWKRECRSQRGCYTNDSSRISRSSTLMYSNSKWVPSPVVDISLLTT